MSVSSRYDQQQHHMTSGQCEQDQGASIAHLDTMCIDYPESDTRFMACGHVVKLDKHQEKCSLQQDTNQWCFDMDTVIRASVEGPCPSCQDAQQKKADVKPAEDTQIAPKRIYPTRRVKPWN